MNTKPITETVDQARQGETSKRMRWVLLATLVLTIAGVGVSCLMII